MKLRSVNPESYPERASRAGSTCRTGAVVGCMLLLIAAGCGDDQNVIQLQSVYFDTPEDQLLEGAVAMTGGRAYSVVQQSAAGEVTIDQSSGRFSFVPRPNFFGDTTFSYLVRNGANGLARGIAAITVRPVNDPPQIATIGDVANSAETFVLDVQLDPQDVDGDVNEFSATTEQPDVVGFELDERTGKLKLFPRREGVAVFRVRAADDQYTDEEEFRFIVKRVTRRNTIPPDSLAEEVVEVLNPLEEPLRFRLNVNDRLFPGSVVDILERLSTPPTPTADHSIAKSVWAGLVSSVSRGYTFTESRWVHDPVILLNSVGAAYCDDFASAYYALMREAGFQARVWTLNGHVVPEVFENDNWRLYDPDMGVYYLRGDGAIAGVEDLVGSSELITRPIGGEHLIQRVGDSAPYSEEVANIFSSAEDNLVWDYYMTVPKERTFEIVLPPGASLAFPGGWEAPPPDLAGRLPTSYANLKVTVPGGWLGSFSIPLILLDVRGYGSVKIGEREFAIGSAELEAAIASRTQFIEGVSIIRADTDVELIYMINPRIISADGGYLIELEGVQVAALRLARAALEPQHSLLN